MGRSIEQFIDRCEMTAIAGPFLRQGCSEGEIRALETKYDVRLPRTYRVFLEVMGKLPGRLFQHDHTLATYRDVLTLTEMMPREVALEQPEKYPEPPQFLLPGGLIIASRLLEANWIIRCDDSEDSPVWYVDTNDFEFHTSHDSVVEWLYGWLWEAEEAVKSGWYDRY